MKKLFSILTHSFAFFGIVTSALTFFFADYDEIIKNPKYNSTMNYLTTHWSSIVAFVFFCLTVYLFRLSVKQEIKKGLKNIQEDFNEKNKGMISSVSELQRTMIPDVLLNNRFIREILLKCIDETKLYKEIDKEVFDYKTITIYDLEKFGLDKSIIAKLKLKQLEIQKKQINEHNSNN